MADGYATLANGGIHHDPTAISRVEFPDGKVDEPDPDSGERVLTEGQAYDVTKLLEGVITQGTGAGYTSWAAPPRRARPAPRRTSPTPGSSATRRSTRPRSGSATRSRAKRPASAVRPRGRSGAHFMESAAVNGDCPEFEVPVQPARTLRPRQRTHPLLLRAAPKAGEEEETLEDEEGKGRNKKKGRAAKNGRERSGTSPEPPPDASGPHASAGPRHRPGVGGGVAASKPT